MSILVALASGKGGVGKSVLAANLAFQLAHRGQRVILVDLDWGGSNAHTLLGVLNTNPGIGRYMLDKGCLLADLVLPLTTPGLSFIPGDGLVAGAANIPFVRKQKLLRELAGLDADYVVLDLAAGSHFNTVDMFLASGLGIMVATPEPTSILNAYGFLKTALYRLLSQGVPAKSEARAHIQDYFAGKTDLQGRGGLEHLLAGLAASDPAYGAKLTAARGRLRPRVVLNMGMDPSELNLGARLRQVCERQLGLGIEYISFVPWDEAVRPSVVTRQLLAQHHPDRPFSRAAGTLAQKIMDRGIADVPPMGNSDDLEALATPL